VKALPVIRFVAAVAIAQLLAGCKSEPPRLTFQEKEAIEARWRADTQDCQTHPLTNDRAEIDSCVAMVNREREDRLAGRTTQWETVKNELVRQPDKKGRK
jgi:hypothetical protein